MATGVLDLVGVWVHDPLDPQDTARQFLYGAASRSLGVQVEQEGQSYAGRTFPVYDFGEHQGDSFSVRMDVPHGPLWAADVAALLAFAETRSTLCVRDNRGRMVVGALDGYQESDTDFGTQVSFAVNRAAV